MTVSFRVKLLASHAVVALAVGVVTLVVVERSVSQRMEAQIDERLEVQARALFSWAERTGHPDRLASRLAGVVGARVTILDSKGRSLGESHEASISRTTALPEEVRAAQQGRVGRETRLDSGNGQRVRYVAVPTPGDLVIRLGVPIGVIDETKAELRRQLGVGGLVSLGVAFLLAALVAGPLTRRLRQATAIAKDIAVGHYDIDPPPPSRDEIGILSRTLASTARELGETEARRRAFLATVAHEIRTPVTSILGFAQTLSDSQVPASDREEFANTIHRNAVRISKLVDDLLELEAIEAGKANVLERDEVPVEPVASNVVRTLRTQADRLAASITVDIDDDVVALGSADSVERILLNLTENALRHGGNDVKVVVAGRREGDQVVVEVSDDGPGVPAEQREQIFERFHRGVADPGKRGSGLGLAIARELARAMGGTLTLVDGEREGARFAVTLPAASRAG